MTTYSNTPGALKTTFSPWLRSFNASGMLLPIVLAFLRPTWSFPSFSPRQPIYSNDLVPMIFAPWASPTSGLGVLSHFLQALLFWHLPASALIYCYPLWICISLVRTVLGHILSRSVGWAYPHLFSHWALYETSDGFGPALLVYLYLVGTTEVLKALPKLRVQFHEVSVMVALCTVLCWLDAAPWTYGVATVCAVILTLCRGVLRVAAARGTVHPMKLDGRPREGSPLRTRSLLGAATLSLLVITIPRVLFSFSSTPAPTFMPASPSPSSPLLEILVLTHPRPNVTAATTILITTLDSYLPFANPNVALSVFTHSATHPAFAHARDKFSQSSIQFYADTDSHPDATSGQYLHLAEAFRWITEKGPYQAEWTMLVEDDFPVCEGERGWDAVKRVMTVLENGRAEKSKLPDRRGGFVGTGGSGLIIHRSLLPVLILLMRTYAESVSKLPPGVPRRPADLIIQDCLLGTDPMCPRRLGGGELVITSRLVMDHIGGMVSTTKGKTGNQDKWRCGWRHPFHGRPEVEVVVV